MRIAIKFGGTSVQDAERLQGAAELVAEVHRQGHEVVVVTSAMAGVTDELVKLAAKAASTETGSSEGRVAEFFHFTRQLEQRHQTAVSQGIKNPKIREEVAQVLAAERGELERMLLGSFLVKVFTPVAHDFVLSAGERLCAPVLAGFIREQGLNARHLGGDEAGIVTDNNCGNALPEEEATREKVRAALDGMLKSRQVPVVAGFYGRSGEGRVAILGRGGSDFSATLLGSALDADEIWIMKADVDGIKTTDPRLVKAAHTIDRVSYAVAAEMALLGAKVLHPRSVMPAARQKIPVRIASSAEPAKPGTRLGPPDPTQPPSVAALTLVRRGCAVRVSPHELGEEGGPAARLIEALREQNVDVLAVSASFNGSSVLWLVGEPHRERFLQLLDQHRDDRWRADIQDKVAVIGLVGERAALAPGLLATVARCLDQAGSYPLAILQGASPNSLVIALPDDKNLEGVLARLHTALGMDGSGGRG